MKNHDWYSKRFSPLRAIFQDNMCYCSQGNQRVRAERKNNCTLGKLQFAMSFNDDTIKFEFMNKFVWMKLWICDSICDIYGTLSSFDRINKGKLNLTDLWNPFGFLSGFFFSSGLNSDFIQFHIEPLSKESLIIHVIIFSPRFCWIKNYINTVIAHGKKKKSVHKTSIDTIIHVCLCCRRTCQETFATFEEKENINWMRNVESYVKFKNGF